MHGSIYSAHKKRIKSHKTTKYKHFFFSLSTSLIKKVVSLGYYLLTCMVLADSYAIKMNFYRHVHLHWMSLELHIIVAQTEQTVLESLLIKKHLNLLARHC